VRAELCAIAKQIWAELHPKRVRGRRLGTGLEPIEILLVEDSPAAALLTTEALRDPKVSYHVQVVVDGEEALKFLHREAPHPSAPRPDLILLDFNLPKVDGRQVLATIKADANLMDIPVIVLTCSSNPSDVEDAYHYQAAGYITKPAALDEYFTAIRSLTQLWFNVMTMPKTARAKAFVA
jgi:CheY-like chemotaxis protein